MTSVVAPSLARTSAPTAAMYATLALFLANVVGYMDRKILSLLVDPVKASLGLSDGEIGLMQGAAFVVTFSITGLLVGRLVDRRSRRHLLVVCIAIWSISAAAGGLAQSGWQLFAARMGVGVGEAALIPAAVSLFADYFPPERRGKPFGFFSMGVYAGSGLSLVLVGVALQSLATFSASLAARGYAFEPWRLVMLFMLIPGIVCCALVLAIREPERTGAGATTRSVDRSGLRDWLVQRRFLLPHHLSMSMVTFGLLGMANWVPTILIREYGMSPRDAGLLYGTVYALGGVCSSYLGGVVSDMANRRDGARGCLVLALCSIVVVAIGFTALPFVATPIQLMAAIVLVFAPSSVALVTGIMVVSDTAPGQSRGQVTAVHFLFTGILGTAGGPAAVGYANDLFGSATVPLSKVLGIAGLISSLLALALAWAAKRRLHLMPADQEFASAK